MKDRALEGRQKLVFVPLQGTLQFYPCSRGGALRAYPWLLSVAPSAPTSAALMPNAGRMPALTGLLNPIGDEYVCVAAGLRIAV